MCVCWHVRSKGVHPELPSSSQHPGLSWKYWQDSLFVAQTRRSPLELHYLLSSPLPPHPPRFPECHSTSVCVCNSASQLSLPEIAVLPSPTYAHTLPLFYLHTSPSHYLYRSASLSQPLQRNIRVAEQGSYGEGGWENRKRESERLFTTGGKIF